MVLVKIHSSSGSSVLAVCDENLIGKTLREGNLQIVVSDHFYKGEEKPDAEVIELMKASANINILGKRSIALAIKTGVIEEGSIIMLQGVPHAQVAAS